MVAKTILEFSFIQPTLLILHDFRSWKDPLNLNNTLNYSLKSFSLRTAINRCVRNNDPLVILWVSRSAILVKNWCETWRMLCWILNRLYIIGFFRAKQQKHDKTRTQHVQTDQLPRLKTDFSKVFSMDWWPTKQKAVVSNLLIKVFDQLSVSIFNWVALGKSEITTWTVYLLG